MKKPDGTMPIATHMKAMDSISQKIREVHAENKRLRKERDRLQGQVDSLLGENQELRLKAGEGVTV